MANPERSSHLKVLIQSPYPLRHNRPDGVANFIIESVPYLEQKGCRVRLVGPSIKNGDRNAARLELGRTVKVAQNKTVAESSVSFNKERAKRILLAVKPDIVVMHEPLAGHSAHTMVAGCPKDEEGKPVPAMVGHFHARSESLSLLTRVSLDFAMFLRRVRFNKYGVPVGMTAGYLNTVFGNLDGSIAVSKATADFRKRIYPGECKVIPNGINTEELTPDGPRIEEWEDGRKTILFAGRHDERKGIDDLVRAFALLKNKRDDVKLKITGEGKETDKLKRLVGELGVKEDVEFVGILPREDLVRAYRTADIFASPAIGGEGFGRTLAEALACGTTVVATDIEGYREVVRYGDPFAGIAQPRNPQDLSNVLCKKLDVPDERKGFIKHQAREYVQRFSWETVADQTVDYYKQCLDRHGRTPRSVWPRK
jgi:phosphatidyl-myo-inositol alpha-mannosyltransferase